MADEFLDINKADQASDSSFDYSPGKLKEFEEDIKRKALGRQMTMYLAWGLAILCLIFLTLSFCKVFHYLEFYKSALSEGKLTKNNLISYIIPFVPYTLMATLGLICLITLSRLVSTYTNNTNSDETELLTKLINALGNLFKPKSD